MFSPKDGSFMFSQSNLDHSNIVCVICFDKIPDVVFRPCGHGGVCYDCAVDVMKKNGECYLCREVYLFYIVLDNRRNFIIRYFIKRWE